MMDFPRRVVLAGVMALPLLSGCASDVCNQLVFEEKPVAAPPLAMPDGVPAVAEGGEYRIPNHEVAAAPEGCQARPPQTLPPEFLEDPEDGDEPEEA